MNDKLRALKSKFDLVRLWALIRKETIQMVRDPSTFLIAGILPALLLFLFATAVSLDIKNVPIALVRETDSVKAQSLSSAYSGSKYFIVHPVRSRDAGQKAIVAGKVKAIVIIPANFDSRSKTPNLGPLVEIIANGGEPNTGRFVANMAAAVADNWAATNSNLLAKRATPMVEIMPRFWFNAELDSRRSLIPGAIAIVMNMIGTLLTSMVIAREWERGTMEAIMATPSNVLEILIGKILPYFALGMVAVMICTISAIVFYHVPMRGSWFALLLLSAAFLIPSLGQGILISAATKDQFSAAQISVFSGFLPAMMFSGFLYETSSMPWPLALISHIVPAKYYVESIRTVFLVGDVWSIFLPSIGYMLAIGAVFLFLAAKNSSKTLDGK